MSALKLSVSSRLCSTLASADESDTLLTLLLMPLILFVTELSTYLGVVTFHAIPAVLL